MEVRPDLPRVVLHITGDLVCAVDPAERLRAAPHRLVLAGVEQPLDQLSRNRQVEIAPQGEAEPLSSAQRARFSCRSISSASFGTNSVGTPPMTFSWNVL
ncbi:hypothetical protein [Neorhizobium vignae]|uniref:hypothetical protein n=1 Tax=Neorhizobium vignae TaxID=690585 RepID=UPI00055F6F67|nr:hypothetical protein [Neorhizobium vignae]